MDGFSRYLRSKLAEQQLTTRQLAERAGLGRSTVYLYLNGTKPSSPDERTLQALARALRVPVADLRRAANLPDAATVKFELPPEAARLTPRQRKAVLAVVSAFLESTPRPR